MSIKDVAREAGVSTATVSHVLNKTRFVSEETRLKVVRAIERCNYYPNAHARSLASGRSHTIGLLVSDISNPFFPELAKSVEDVAFERGYDVILLNTKYDAQRTSHYVRRLIERQVAGVALMTSELDFAVIDELASKHVSVVFLDLGTAGERMSNLAVDYAMGITEAVRHLVQLGHKSIAYLGGPNRLRSAAKRLEAFRNALAQVLPNVEPFGIFEGDFQLDGGRRIAREILSGGTPLPTAIITANDMMALGVMQECRAAGVSIPRDVSIVGFDDIAFASLAYPQLTTVCLPRLELGRRAVEALLMTIEEPEHQGVELRIPTYLVKRSSVGRARNSFGYEDKRLSA
ncbi:MAG: LacI family DNA-binding transcriptional regulator [Pyrinomonadaceae bacterium]